MGFSDENKKSTNVKILLGQSKYYVLTWGIMEALRELLANMIDAMTENLLKIDAYKHRRDIEIHCVERCGYLEFSFSFRGEPLGSIKYDAPSGGIVLENVGTIPRRCLSMGGSGKMWVNAEKRREIIGVFGEGMKLAVLVLLRGGKLTSADEVLPSYPVIIFTGGEKWVFSMDSVEALENESCLHCTVFSNPSEEMAASWTRLVIGKMPANVWNEVARKIYIPMREAAGEKFERVDVKFKLTPNGNETSASLIMNLLNEIYVKDIWICKSSEVHDFSYSFDDLPLTRDRLQANDIHDQYRRSSYAMCAAVQKREENQEDPVLQAHFERILKKLYHGIKGGFHEHYYVREYCEKQKALKNYSVAHALWRLYEADPAMCPAGKVRQPHYAGTVHTLHTQMKTLGVNESTYPRNDLNWMIAYTLYNAMPTENTGFRGYRNLADHLNYLKEKKCREDHVTDVHRQKMAFLQTQVSKVRSSPWVVHCMDFEVESTFTQGNDIYVSKHLLNGSMSDMDLFLDVAYYMCLPIRSLKELLIPF